MKTKVLILIFSICHVAGCAQDKLSLNKVWTYYEFEKVDKIGMIGGIEKFRILDFTKQGILLIKGIPNKTDTAVYTIKKDQIIIKSINGVPDFPDNLLEMEIRIARQKKYFLDLLFTIKENGTQKGAFKLKYKSGN